MIELTRLNGHKLYLNCDLVKCAEASPDTTLTMVTGDKIVILESCAELTSLVFANRIRILQTAWPNALAALAVQSAHTASAWAAEQLTGKSE